MTKVEQIKKDKLKYIMLAPYFILFSIFTVIPVIISIIISMTDYNLFSFPHFIWLDNYRNLFLNDDIFLIALKNTFILALVTGPLSYIASFLLAWIINEFPNKIRAFLTLIFYAPSISGNAYLVWKIIFAGDVFGYANANLINLGIISEPIQWLANPEYILPILIIVQLWLSLGVSFLSFIAGLQYVDKSMYEAGAIDGVKNRWQELWYITLPSMKPQLLFGAVIQITTSFSLASVSTEIAGFPSINYAGHTIVTHLADYGEIRYEMGYASAIATILFLMMFLTNLLVQRVIKKVGN